MAGTPTGALASGGRLGPGPDTATVEQYDGTNWTSAPSMNTARRYLRGFGLQTLAIVAGGSPDGSADAALTEKYDGTSWTEVGDLGTARNLGGTSQNSPSGDAGFYAAGNTSGGTPNALTEEFNITVMTVTQGAWSSAPSLNTGRKRAMGAGIQTAALMASGFTSPPNAYTANVEEYNGSSWSEVTNIPSARSFGGYGGTQTAGVLFGGTTPVFAATLHYDGTNWTAGGDLGTARYRIGGAGTQTAALGFGGYIPGASVNVHTEEYDGSSWTGGGDLNTARSHLLSCSGIQTDAMAINGGSGYTDDTEIYNGSAWTAGSDTLFGNRGYVASAGTSTSALRLFTAGMASPSPRKSAESQTYDGSAFSTAPSLATARKILTSAAAATSATAMGYGGETVTGNSTATEEFTAGSTALNLKTITDS